MDDGGTATEAGVVKRELLSARVTVVVAVAAFVNATVQVLEAPDAKLVGVQLSEETVKAEARLMVAVFDAPLRVAVTVAD